jgi:flagellar protein FlaG
MSAETFTSAMFLITAVLAAGVLINAVFPVVYNMAGTFNTASHESDERMRTDFKMITTLGDSGDETGRVWMKNIGSTRIPLAEIERSDVFFGPAGNFDRRSYESGQWIVEFTAGDYDLNSNGYWDPGETVKITVGSATAFGSGDLLYFQFSLPNGIWRSTEFTAR